MVQRSARTRFPVGTLTVNLAGSLMVGIVFGLTEAGSLTRVLLVGLSGGFTTFSTWSTESLAMLRTGRPVWAALNLGGTPAIGVVLCAAGYSLAH
jgi:CrcB protein